MFIRKALSLLALLLLLACGQGVPTATLTPTAPSQTPLPTPTSTMLPTLEATPVSSPTPVATPTPPTTATPVLATPTVTRDQIQRGVSLSPRSFASSDFTDFFQKAREAGSLVSWAGDWQELGNPTGGGPTVLAELASTYGYKPVIVAQFFTQSSGQLLRPMDVATRQSYRDSARAFVKKYKPRYLGLGIEVNMLYEKSPSDFDGFVELFANVYRDVKSVSPTTQVFTVFQLERMKGLRGGLFGGTNEPGNTHWNLLDRFPDSDIVAFTTYPDLIFKDPGDIPPDYYSEIKAHTAKGTAFIEVGWHTAANPAGWESSETEQGRFVKAFFGLTRDLDPEIVIWSFLYDQNAIEPFRSMGLLRSDGSARPAWEEWTRSQ